MRASCSRSRKAAVPKGGSGFDDITGDDDGGASGAVSSGGKSGSGGIVTGASSGAGGSSSSGGAACATAKSKAERQPVYLDIILDGSGSMDSRVLVCRGGRNQYCQPNTYTIAGYDFQCGGDGEFGECPDVRYTENDPQKNGRWTGKKWIAARDSLKAYFDATAPAASPALGVGLSLFSSTNPGQEPIGVLDAAQAGALYNRIKPEAFPLNATPLRASIDAQATYLRAYDPALPLLPGGRRVILLITDGVPVGVDANDTSETKDTVRAAVQQALAGTPKVETAVIGVGDPTVEDDVYDETFLSQLAVLGGLAPAGCKENWNSGDPETPCHLQVTPGEKSAAQIKDEMTTAINAIAGAVASCTLALDKSSPIDPAKVNVVYTDAAGTETQLAQDSENGWSYDNPADPGQVILHGAACTKLQNENGEVNIIVGCPTGTTVVN